MKWRSTNTDWYYVAKSGARGKIRAKSRGEALVNVFKRLGMNDDIVRMMGEVPRVDED